MGQSTEETFYELADEYGMMVWNDFWESTENYNIEAEDPQLFLDNAADTIQRFRNHPSIVMWCGRNEGVPQPIINLGLDQARPSSRRHPLLLAQLQRASTSRAAAPTAISPRRSTTPRSIAASP